MTPITKQEIKALKNCDDIGFFNHGNTAGISANLHVANSSTGFAQSVHIHTVSGVSDYTENSIIATTGDYNCDYITAAYETTMQTILYFLKENDEIVLIWIHGNNSTLVNDCGLMVDELYLKIERGKKEYKFLITYKIYNKYSYCKMIEHKQKIFAVKAVGTTPTAFLFCLTSSNILV